MAATEYEKLVEQAGTRRTVELPDPTDLFSVKKSTSDFPKGTQVKYYTANLSDNSSRVLLQEILTKSLMCQGNLRNIGDVVVIQESGTFDKDGCYNVMIKYFELCTE